MKFRPEVLWLEDRCLLTTITVTTLSDAPTHTGISLHDAIANAQLADTVDFQPGLTGTIALSSTLTINKVLTITGPGASVITVSGNNAVQVFNIPVGFTVAISDLSIANGNGGFGTGINNAGRLAITDCTLSHNSTGTKGSGGGIYNTGTLTITGSTLSDNSALRSISDGTSFGGGICNTGTIQMISNCTFSNDFADTGGGIYNTGTIQTVSNCTFSVNSASSAGGGVYNTGTILLASNCVFNRNSTSSTSSAGGGIFNTDNLTVTNSTFSDNTTALFGGGIRNLGGNVTIAYCTFSRNVATSGAGVANDHSAAVTITSSTLSNNFASSQGGGIYHTGGGMLKIGNTIIAKNSPPGSSPDVVGAVNSQGYNFIGDGTGSSGLTGPGDQVGSTTMPKDPLLDALKDNGGPTFTMEVLPRSPVLNQGDPGQLSQADQRGVMRSGGVNIGAYQASASTFVVTVPPQATAGVPFDVTVTAMDRFGKVAFGYTGTVDFTTGDTDVRVVLPHEYNFTINDAGARTFTSGVTLFTAGTQMITVTDAANNIIGSASIIVLPSKSLVDHFLLSAPGSTGAGSPFALTVTAVDAQGQPLMNYTGTVMLESSDPYPGWQPLTYTFTQDDNGTHTFPDVTLFTAGMQTLTVQDAADNTLTGSTTINVVAAAANHLLLTAPATATAGASVSATITALDPYDNLDTAFTGTVTLTSSDRNPHPLVYTFAASDNGTHTFSTSLFTAGSQTLSAWVASNLALRGSLAVVVTAAPANHFLVTAPSSVTANSRFDLVLSALDPYGNTDSSYQGTVHFTSSDTDLRAVLPQDYTFASADQGVHTFAGSFLLVTAGPQTITATDIVNAAIMGSAPVTVTPAPVPPPGGGANLPSAPNTGPQQMPAPEILAIDRALALLSASDPGLLQGGRAYASHPEVIPYLLDAFGLEEAWQA